MTTTATETRSSFAYRPALDGLRAVSVAAVFAYHLQYDWAGGGFLGVDVFFVLSGYLISSLLLGEWSRAGGIDLRAFWGRRARRLLPAVFFLLLSLAAYAAVVTPADQLNKLRGDSLATLLYVQNWWLIVQGQSYFDLYAAPSPLRHAWSLAIEEQFYIVWPLVMFAALRWRRGSRRPILVICLLGTAASVAWMWLCFDPVEPSRAYYGTGARAQTLLVGALLAVALEGREGIARRWRWLVDGLGATAFAACIACFALVSDAGVFFYTGGSLLFSVTVAVVIVAAVQPDRMPFRRVLALAPLRWLGRISYGVYLWHWPVIVVLTESRVGLDGGVLAGVQVAATLLLSVASFVLVERPVRYGALRERISVGHAIAGVAGIAGVILVATTGGVAPPAFLKTPPEIEAAALDDGAIASGNRRPSSSVTPTIGVVGGSVARSLIRGLADVAEPLGFKVLNGSVPGCGVAVPFAVRRDGVPFSWSERCPRMIKAHIDRLLAGADRMRFVLWLSTWDSFDQLLDGRHVRFKTREGDRLLVDSMDRLVGRFATRGVRVAMLTPPDHARNDRFRVGRDPGGYRRHYHELLREFARKHSEDVVLVDLAAMVCPDGRPCPRYVEGKILRPDGTHFSREGASWVARRMLASLLAEIK